jgi:cobalt/nickel transport system permease protein
MHIPDGFLSTPIWTTSVVAGIASVSFAARRAQRELPEARTPLLGVMGAFVFAAQMINFPVGPGTSGHLVGGTLLAAVLGPAAATVVLTAILIVQALVFQDGGVLALGANTLNMAVAGVLAGYLPYALSGRRKWGLFAGGALSVLVSATLTVAELLLSGIRIPTAFLWTSLVLFVVNAALEGAITVAVARALERINPVWLAGEQLSVASGLRWVTAGAVALACAGVLLASAMPDGLEHLAEQAGFAAQAKSLFSTPVADYQIQGMPSEWISKASAGLAGLLLVYGACLVLGRVVVRARS